jgi:hypothetical protein
VEGGLPTKLCKKRTGEGNEVIKGLPPCVLLEKVTSRQEDFEEVIGIHPTQNLTIWPFKQVEDDSYHCLHFPDPKVILCGICL